MDKFYRAGGLVFGGGHVVLPLLEKEVVDAGLVSKENFLVGYGFSQSIPGPMFAFSAFLGGMSAYDLQNSGLGNLWSLIFSTDPSEHTTAIFWMGAGISLVFAFLTWLS